MSTSVVKTPSFSKLPTSKLALKRPFNRELSVNLKKSGHQRESSCESFKDLQTAKALNSFNPCNKRMVPKFLEEGLKDSLSRFNERKILAIKREKSNEDSEKLFICFLMVFGELDHSINTRGMKVNPREVMMNYLATPLKVLKTFERIEFYLKNSRLTEGNCKIATLVKSFSLFTQVKIESLSTSKIIHSLLSSIFDFMGLDHKENHENHESLTSNTLDLAKSAYQMMKGKNEIKRNLPGFLFKTADSARPEVTFSDVAFLLETSNRPPRISQKYLESKTHRSSRSHSEVVFVVKPQVVS